MTATPGAQAAPVGDGGGLRPRRPGDLVPLICGHLREVIFNDPLPVSVALWCDQCGHVRAQTADPNPPQVYEMAVARYRAAVAERRHLEYLAELASQGEDDAQAALCAVEHSPGIPAYTQTGGQP